MNRRAIGVGTLVGAVVLAVAILALTPWHPLGAGAPAVHGDASRSFTPAEIARAARFRDRLGPWPYVALLLALAVPWVVVLGARARSHRTPRPDRLRRRWPTLVGTVVAVAAVRWLVTLPMGLHSERVLRAVGLSTQGWAGWFRDEALGWLMSVAVTALGILVLAWLVRRAPRRWPWIAAAAALVLTVLGSAVYPLVVESAYNSFTPLPAGPLSSRIQALAARDGLGHVDILVSDASKRTTGENAHVSGLGATHRVVLDDTVVAQARKDPEAVVAIVAHEFGHVRHHDVVRGTVVGAAAAFAGVLALALLLTTRVGRSLFTPESRGRAALVGTAALVMAIAATAPYVAAPVSDLVSRRIEANADVLALDATHNVPAFVRMQHDLAITNINRLEPAWWQTWWFSTHPSPPWRIAQAHVWQQLHR